MISNNLANVATNGFKGSRPEFEDLLYQTVRQPGAQSSQSTVVPSGLMLGLGVRVVSTEKMFTQGTLQQTGNPLDLAIQGNGFFQILQPDGTLAYTRDGSFQTDNTGQLVTANGHQVQPTITIPSGTLSVTVGTDGSVSALSAGSPTPQVVGQLTLANFINPTGLQPLGSNVFAETSSSGAPLVGTAGLNGLGSIVQGTIETSNVNVVAELVNMIETQRAYEMNSKAIETVNQMLQFTSQTL